MQQREKEQEMVRGRLALKYSYFQQQGLDDGRLRELAIPNDRLKGKELGS
jgi:hypothetical protein